jgi:phosphoribosylformylglycinamidine (FGAM) synthase PurS component
VKQLAATFLANTVIEDFDIRVIEQSIEGVA